MIGMENNNDEGEDASCCRTPVEPRCHEEHCTQRRTESSQGSPENHHSDAQTITKSNSKYNRSQTLKRQRHTSLCTDALINLEANKDDCDDSISNCCFDLEPRSEEALETQTMRGSSHGSMRDHPSTDQTNTFCKSIISDSPKVKIQRRTDSTAANGTTPINNESKEKTKKKKERQDTKTDIQRQLEHSIATIHKMERKIEELEISNRQLHFLQRVPPQHVPPNTPYLNNPLNSENAPHLTVNPNSMNSDNVYLRQKVKDLELEMIRSRLSSIENFQQMTLHLQGISSRCSLMPPYTQGPVVHNHSVYPNNQWSHPLPRQAPHMTRFPPPQMMQPPMPGMATVRQFTPSTVNFNTYTVPPMQPQQQKHDVPLNTNRKTKYTMNNYEPQNKERYQFKTGSDIPRFEPPPRFVQKRTYIGKNDIHSTPKKVRFENASAQDNSGLTHSPILITSPDTQETVEHVPRERQQSFLVQGRASECTDRTPQQVKVTSLDQ